MTERALVDSFGKDLFESGSWTRIEVDPVLRGEVKVPPATMMRRTDGVGLVYPGRISTFYGEPESLKSWIAIEACRQVLAAGGTALYLDYEDGGVGPTQRLREMAIAWGQNPSDYRDRFVSFAVHGPVRSNMHKLVDIVSALSAELVVVDNVNDAMTLDNWDLESNRDVAEFYSAVPRQLTHAGAAVLLIDHVVKGSRNRWPIGGQAKLAAVDGAAFLVESTKRLSRGNAGSSKVLLAKDRSGQVAALAGPKTGGSRTMQHVATLHAKSWEDQGGTWAVRVTLDPPDAGQLASTDSVVAMVRFLESQTDWVSWRNAIHKGGGRQANEKALGLLIAQGFVEVREENRARLLRLARTYPEGQPITPDWWAELEAGRRPQG